MFRVCIEDEFSKSDVTMKEPINHDIFELISLVRDALIGMSFHRETVYEGMKAVVEEYEKVNNLD